MNQRATLLFATGITAFVLVIIGGLAARLSGMTSLAQSDATDPSSITAAPPVDAAYQEREAAYQAALAEANRRLEQANRQLAQQGEAAAVAAPVYAVTAEQAQAVALDSVPGAALLRPAELVAFQGTPAYEVVLDRGTLYVDAQSAAVLASSAAANAQGVAPAYGGEHREHGDDEHGDDEHGDDEHEDEYDG
jgi:hypothetical protein